MPSLPSVLNLRFETARVLLAAGLGGAMLTSAACPSEPPSTDGGPAAVDAGDHVDAGPMDAGQADAGVVLIDAGHTDAGSDPVDAGSDADAGRDPDAGRADAGVMDAGDMDAGLSMDAGALDAGSEDAGHLSDGGSVDAGVMDAGSPVDAGMPDAGDVDAGPIGAELALELTWSPGERDLDLILAKTALCDADAVNFLTEQPDWDGSGGPSAGDPALVDDAVRAGPERIVWTAPAAGSYVLGVHHYAQSHEGGPRPTLATVTVRQGGMVVSSHDVVIGRHAVFTAPLVLTAPMGATLDWESGTMHGNYSGECDDACGCAPTEACLDVVGECTGVPPLFQACAPDFPCAEGQVCIESVCMWPDPV